jgi:hypothetical protein
VSPTELTAVISAITALVGTPIFTTWMNRRKTTVTSVAKMYKDERDRWERKFDEAQLTNANALIAVEAKWKAQHEEDQAQIAQLRAEIDTLYRRLYSAPPPLAPA